MNILTVETIRTEVWKQVTISFDRKKWELHIVTVDGKVNGGYERVSTAQLGYHDYPIKTRQRIFKQIKAFLEND